MNKNEIEEFLADYPDKGTRANYRSQLNNFFRAINVKNPDKYISGCKNGRDYKADVNVFWLSMNGRPPKSIIFSMSIVKMFFEFHEIDIPKKVWRNLGRKTKGHRARTQDMAPSPFQLKQILSHGGALERAAFLISSSTGMRIDEVIKLTKEDIDFDSDPMKINVPVTKDQGTKSGDPRYCFASNEAKVAILEWLKERDGRLEVAIARGRNKRNKETGKEIFAKVANANQIFPYSYVTMRGKWIRLLRLSGFDQRDKSTGRYLLHIHSLKKYFMSRMKLELPVIIVECLGGHEAYLDEAYRRYTPEQIGEFYKKGEHLINVFERGEDAEKLEKFEQYKKEKEEKEIALEKEMVNLSRDFGGLKDEYRQLNKKYEWLEEKRGGVEQKVKPFASYQAQDILMNTDVDAFMHEYYNNSEFEEKLNKILEGIKKKVEKVHKQQTRLEITCSL